MSQTGPPPSRRPVLESLSSRPSGHGRTMTPLELCDWLIRHEDDLAGRWLVEVKARADDLDRDVAHLLEDLFSVLVSFLPPGVGPWRDEVEPLFQQAAELYGSLGAVRGLAAGEAVEEFQLLREVLLRFLYLDSAAGDGGRIELREALRLNRMIDLGVTHASVGHTDALFFNLLHGTGVTDRPGPGVLDEFRTQMRGLKTELDRLGSRESPDEASPKN